MGARQTSPRAVAQSLVLPSGPHARRGPPPHPTAASVSQPADDERALLSSAAANAEMAALFVRIANLEKALKARTVIGQAQGILMERHRWTAAEAFDRLRVTSEHLNRKLRDVAADLVHTGEEATPK